jgi:hypothetical protein
MTAQVNGETPISAFLSVRTHPSFTHLKPNNNKNNKKLTSSPPTQHLYSYPVISDSITTFKSNPYGAKSLDLTSAGYEKLGKPILPYLAKPYQYVSPYVKKADSLGDSTLSTLDSKFPVVKKPTGELYDEGKAIVFFPLKKGTEGKDYVLGVWGGEKKKVGGEGLVTYGKAALATGLIVGSDAYNFLFTYFSKKEAEAKEVTTEKVSAA